jgi:hypothetical protein
MRAFVAGLFIAFLVLEAADPAVVAAQGGASAEIEGLRQELKRLQERLQKLEETRSQPAPSPAAPVAVQAAPPTVAPRPGEREIQLEREHPLEVLGLSKPDISGFRFSGFFSGSASFNSHIQMVPEFAGGGQALSDPRSLNFRFDKFSFGVAKTFASWLSAGAAVEVESHRDRHTHGGPTFGCPDPAAFCIERFGAEEAETEIELHRFNITGVVPLGNGLALSFGRFDTPFGIERHDPNLLLTATSAELFQFGRPNSMTGFQASYQFAPWLDLMAWAVNRWENETTHDPFDDNNRAKSFGGRLGITPFAAGGQLLNIGLGGWWGEEQTDDTANPRWIVDLDVTWSPVPRLILAGEAVYGGESNVSFRRRGVPFAAPAVTGKDVNWWGLYALAHYDIYDWLGLTFRYGFFRDEDAARTGVEQSLQSFTVAPILHLSRLVPALRPLGITYPRTAHPLNWVDVKLEYRANHSNRPVFSDAAPNVPIFSADHWSHQLQLQFVVNY